jgi:SAM-dependent methyltransferase
MPESAKLPAAVVIAGAAPCSASVLDAACGSRMFWFDRKDPRALFVDIRRETHMAADCSVKNGEREIVVNPDILADFTALPFPDNQFWHVIFDPPHIQRNGDTSWILKKYGVLRGNWREMISKGFAECFRVLRPNGTLVFKWNEGEVSVKEILALTPEKPLYGSRYGKHFKSHWIVFQKPNTKVSDGAGRKEK